MKRVLIFILLLGLASPAWAPVKLSPAVAPQPDGDVTHCLNGLWTYTNPGATGFIVNANPPLDSTLTGSVGAGRLSVLGSSAGADGIINVATGANNLGAIFSGLKTRSTSAQGAATTIVADGDDVLSVNGFAADGTTYRDGGGLRLAVQGTPGANIMPTRLSFFTRPIGFSLAPVERMRLATDGIVSIYAIPVYANNAAAITGGLAAGALYRTGADPDPVMVVH